MRRAVPALLAAALAVGCREDAPIPAVDALLRVTAGAAEAEVGRGFPLTVVRVWKKDSEPGEWSDRALAPLSLRLEGIARREDSERVEETRRYEAYAFRLADVAIRAPRFSAVPKSGGPPRVAVAEPIRLRVVRTVDPASPGDPEPPEGPVEPARSRLPRLLAAAGLLAALAVLGTVLVRRRAAARRGRPRLPPEPAPARPARDPAAHAIARLEALRGGLVDPVSLLATLDEASSVVRDYVRARFGVPAHERTTEEVLDPARGGPALAPDAHTALAEALVRCDRAKFSGAAPTPALCDAALASARRFVEATAAERGA